MRFFAPHREDHLVMVSGDDLQRVRALQVLVRQDPHSLEIVTTTKFGTVVVTNDAKTHRRVLSKDGTVTTWSLVPGTKGTERILVERPDIQPKIIIFNDMAAYQPYGKVEVGAVVFCSKWSLSRRPSISGGGGRRWREEVGESVSPVRVR